MKKILGISLISSLIFGGFIFGADFSKKSNDELIKLSGSVDQEDVIDYNKEVAKRVDEMTLKDAKKFKEQLRLQKEETYGNMKVKDLKLRKKAIFEAMKKQCQSNPDSCPKPKINKFGHPNKMGAKHDMEDLRPHDVKDTMPHKPHNKKGPKVHDKIGPKTDMENKEMPLPPR